MKIISLLIIVFAILATILLSSGIGAFIDVPSLLTVIIPVIASISAKHGLEGFKELFREGENQSKILHTMGVTAILSGAIGTMIGLVIMLGHLSDQSAIGPAIAIALLTILYGLLIYLFTTLLSTKDFGEK